MQLVSLCLIVILGFPNCPDPRLDSVNTNSATVVIPSNCKEIVKYQLQLEDLTVVLETKIITNSKHTFQNLKPGTEYLLRVKAANLRGYNPSSKLLKFKTKEEAQPRNSSNRIIYPQNTFSHFD